MHSGVVPLSGGRGHVTEVTLELPDPLTAHNVQPPRLSITDKQINYMIMLFRINSFILSYNKNPNCKQLKICIHMNKYVEVCLCFLTSSTGRSTAGRWCWWAGSSTGCFYSLQSETSRPEVERASGDLRKLLITQWLISR